MFRSFYEFVAGVIGCLFLIPVLQGNVHDLISVFYVIPQGVVWGMIGLVVLYQIYNWIFAKKLQVPYIRYFYYGLLGIIFVDRILLMLISMWMDMLVLTKNPDGFLQSMMYMTYHSKDIWLNGIVGTVKISLLGTVIGFVLAVLLVFLRIQKITKRDSYWVALLKHLGNVFAQAYVTVIRGTPMMVQALIIYFGGFGLLKSFFPDSSVTQLTQMYSFFTAGLITVSLNTTAYLSEVLRSGINGVDIGQTEASASLGFTPWQTMILFVFPQAVKNSIPSICNEFIINIKDTSVLNVIGVSELMFSTNSISSIYFKNLQANCIAAIIYLILTYGLSQLLNLLSKRLDAPVSQGIPSSN